MHAETHLLTGHGRFIDDEMRPGQLHMAVLRSPVAHGAVTDLDVGEARSMPGVHLVLTAADLADEGVGLIPLRSVLTDTDGPFLVPGRPVLPADKVVHVGQAVAAVIAGTVAQALDALEAIVLEIDDLPVVIDPVSAFDQAPIWPGIPGNTAFRWQKGNGAETDALIAKAAHVVTCDVPHPRIAISPIETRGAMGEFDGARYTLTAPSQGVSGLRTAISATMGIAPDDLRVVTHDVGGSFAARIWPYPEHVLVLVAARLCGAPVRWIGSRSEAFVADTPGRARVDNGTLALDEEGRFLAFRIEAIADLGAFVSPAAPSIVTTGAVRPFGQVYDIPGQHYRVSAVLTNAPPADAYRGAGKPESTATLETLIDLAAAETGIDQVALRQRNLIQPEQLPYRTPMAETIDAGDFPAIAATALAAGDWAGVTARKAESRANGRLRGATFGFQMHATGGATTEVSSVQAFADGTVLVRSGAQDSGQSHRATLAVIAAEALEIPVARVRVEQGDSDWAGIAGATGGSNLMPVTANTVHRTALEMIARARERAADLLETAVADVEYGEGNFRVIGTDRAVSLGGVAAAMEQDDAPGCVAQLGFEGNHTTWPNGAMICEIEIDPDTGGVRIDRFTGVNDLGRVIQEGAALGQLLGGIGQGAGEALSEGMVFDADGQPLNGSLMDYALPRADWFPDLALSWAATPSPNALLGAKGVGELPSIGTPALVSNAVLDALRAEGVRHAPMPLTPLKIWSALHK